jgi:hypothetical protein
MIVAAATGRVARLPDLAKRLEAWLDRSVKVELRDPGGRATHNLIIGVEKELLPLSFNVEVGAYINAIRSSLDILAMALVRRRALDISEEKVYFPVARSVATFGDKNWSVPQGTARLQFAMTDLNVPSFHHGGGTVAYSGQMAVPCGAHQHGL